MKIAVIGSNGQLGTDLLTTLNKYPHIKPLSITHQDIEVSNQKSVKNQLYELKPNIVINCAAFHQIDECEKNPNLAFQINTLGALNVAQVCSELNAFCVYISTDYVYNGNKKSPYTESDATSPINIYGTSKLAGEHITSQKCPDSLIIRLSSLFGKAGSKGKGGNFIEAIINKAKTEGRLQVVNDIFISPTYTVDAATTILKLIERKAKGLVHVTNSIPSDCTWFTLAKQTLEFCKIDAQIDAISSNDYPSVANRPIYSVLDNQKAEHITGIRIPDWVDAVKRYLMEKQYIH